LAGKYTIIFQPSQPSGSGYRASGFGVATVSKKGGVTFTGTLSDGSKLGQGGQLVQGNRWPLWQTVDNGAWSISALVEFRDVPWTSDLDGTAVLKRDSAAETLAVVGSAFRPERFGERILNFANDAENAKVAAFIEGQSAPAVVETITVRAKNAVEKAEGSKLKLSIKKATGLFSGQTVLPNEVRPVKFAGVILQKQSRGQGAHFTANQRGLLTFDRVITVTITEPADMSAIIENPVIVRGYVSVKNEIVPLTRIFHPASVFGFGRSGMCRSDGEKPARAVFR
jgi:hypothetical protein